MIINITNKNFNTIKQTELAVVIDVLRAFTTACYLFHNGTKFIIPVEKIEDAVKLKKENPNFILVGERKGFRIPGFDFDNSPTEILKYDFSKKTVIMTTSAGTLGLINAQAKKVITGAFVNVSAIIKYMTKLKPKSVNLFCTDNRYPNNEDFMLALYIKKYLENKKMDFLIIKKHLMHHPSCAGFVKKPLTNYSKNDFKLCMDIDRFNFIIKASKTDQYIYLEKEYV